MDGAYPSGAFYRPLSVGTALGLFCRCYFEYSLKLTNALAYFTANISDEEKSFFKIETWAQQYKTFYGRYLQMFAISPSVCPWQAFPA
jgi:hypothetical protein